MDKAEKLMAHFPGINYIFDPAMPDGQKGLYIDNHVYLNPRQTSEELTDTVAEEIAHYLTSSGDITPRIPRKNANKNKKPVMSEQLWWYRRRTSLTVIKNVSLPFGNAPIIWGSIRIPLSMP